MVKIIQAKLQATFLILILSTASAHAYGESPAAVTERLFPPSTNPFELSLLGDTLVMSSAALVFFSGRYLYEQKALPDIQEVNSLDPSKIFFIDRVTMFDYSKPLHIASGVTEYTDLALPVGVIALSALGVGEEENDSGGIGESRLHRVLEITLMYGEALAYSLGVKDAIKGLVNRYRPYAYGSYYSAGEIAANADSRCSFPSGHTTAAFTGAVFASMIFSKYYPDSVLQLPVWITSLGIATATGVLRVLSGNHFTTDVLGGALIGSFFGFIVPFLHEVKEDDREK